jgi:hypothetical protein
MIQNGYFTTFNLLDKITYLMHSSFGCVLKVKRPNSIHLNLMCCRKLVLEG